MEAITYQRKHLISWQETHAAQIQQSSALLNFIYFQDPTVNPDALQANIDAARVNAFYIVNTVHDFSYLYGFTEAAYNFQNSNFGKGGSGNDRVTISVQDANGIDNADFATPPDGQSGRMRMFLWDLTSPQRDGALENDIVVHEVCGPYWLFYYTQHRYSTPPHHIEHPRYHQPYDWWWNR